MAGNQSFLPMTLTAAVDTGNANTAASTTILASTLYTSADPNALIPGQVRIMNISANMIFVSFSVNTASVAVVPVPGTPSLQWGMLPGTVEVFTLPHGNGKKQVIVNTISTVGNANRLLLQFGEGL